MTILILPFFQNTKYHSVTDSLCYEIITDDVYKDFMVIQDLFDTSNYAEDHALVSTVNKKVPGAMKDELGGNILLYLTYLHSDDIFIIFHC